MTTTQQEAVCRVLSVNSNSDYAKEVSHLSSPSTSPAVPVVPQMNFSSCSVHIYQGTVNAPVGKELPDLDGGSKQ